MFELSMGAILALILLFLFPSLLIATFYFFGFAAFSLISGGITYYLASWLGVLTQNAFWIGAVVGFLTGAFTIYALTRPRRRSFDRVVVR